MHLLLAGSFKSPRMIFSFFSCSFIRFAIAPSLSIAKESRPVKEKIHKNIQFEQLWTEYWKFTAKERTKDNCRNKSLRSVIQSVRTKNRNLSRTLTLWQIKRDLKPKRRSNRREEMRETRIWGEIKRFLSYPVSICAVGSFDDRKQLGRTFYLNSLSMLSTQPALEQSYFHKRPK
jgi:hypothetical protein